MLSSSGSSSSRSSHPRPVNCRSCSRASVDTKNACNLRKKLHKPDLKFTRLLPLPSSVPPPCEPIQTNLLWRRVHQAKSMPKAPSYMHPTESSAGRRKIQPSSQVTTATPPSSATSVSVRTRPRVTDKRFRQDVLQHYGIVVMMQEEVPTPFEHFETPEPSGSIREWYRRDTCSDVWLSHGRDEATQIATQYRNMIANKEEEAKFSHRGKNYFFKEDDIPGRDDDRDRRGKTYFKLEWAPNPDGVHLRCPPSITPSESNFEFKTNPDCTYWLSTRRINPTYSVLVRTYTYIIPNAEVTAPYLTIEFKKDGMSFEAAENQLAASATLILYNRFRLRCARLNKRKQKINQETFNEIKHYCVAFNGCDATFYVATPVLQDFENLENTWAGCKLQMIASHDATTIDGVLSICQWVNEIHSWGLGPHTDHFAVDIKGLIYTSNPNRVSLTQSEKILLNIENPD